MKDFPKHSYKIFKTNDITISKSQEEFAVDVLIGLSQEPKWLPCKYMYDEKGSRLFQNIMALPEYYLTRCETELLDTHKVSIAEILGNKSFNLVELGVGDGRKTKILIKQFMERGLDFHFVPIDISESAIKELLNKMESCFADLKIEGLVSEYFNGLNRLSNLNQRRNVVLFLGSNIGNFNPPETRVFLSSLWNALNDGDYLLIGFDLKKEINIINRAYNDPQGITAQFNLNLLKRINHELGGDFNLQQFQFYSYYDVFSGAVKSFLVSLKKQPVFVETLNRLFSFREWEPIHTESSYKFGKTEIQYHAEQNGFEVIADFYDSNEYFVDSFWQVKK